MKTYQVTRSATKNISLFGSKVKNIDVDVKPISPQSPSIKKPTKKPIKIEKNLKEKIQPTFKNKKIKGINLTSLGEINMNPEKRRTDSGIGKSKSPSKSKVTRKMSKLTVNDLRKTLENFENENYQELNYGRDIDKEWLVENLKQQYMFRKLEDPYLYLRG